MNLLVRTLDPKELQHLREQFEVIDTDMSKLISIDELKLALNKIELNKTDEEIA